MIMKVAVPPLKHSLRLGQLASSHTVTRLFLRRMPLMRSTSGEPEMRMRNQSGLRWTASLAMTLTGMRSTLSALRNFSPRRCRSVRRTGLSAARSSGSCTESLVRSFIKNIQGVLCKGPAGEGQHPGQLIHQSRLDLREVRRAYVTAVAHVHHSQPLIATGVDSVEGLQVHVHVQRQPVVAAAAPHPQTKGGNLLVVRSIDTGRVRLGKRLDAVRLQGRHQAVFDTAHQLADAHTAPPQVDHGIGDQLAGAVIGRSEERRVGKDGRSRDWTTHIKEKTAYYRTEG